MNKFVAFLVFMNGKSAVEINRLRCFNVMACL